MISINFGKEWYSNTKKKKDLEYDGFSECIKIDKASSIETIQTNKSNEMHKDKNF